MNRVYRLVWNDRLAAYVPVAETARGRGKKTFRLRALSAAVLAVVGVNAHALPGGGQVSAGQGSIAQSGSAMTVTQQSPRLAINWQSFGIGASESVNFVQPSASAIALNRVLGSDPSQILGRLSANGQVWILNPNGLLFGSNAQISVGGLIGSTLQMNDADFLAGKSTFSGNGGTVTNQGSITAADGGYVALFGGRVSNEGVIQARLGTVALGAGKQVTLDFAGVNLLNLQVDQGAVNALVQNKQLIRADGGTVLLTAKAADALLDTVVNNEGIIEARTIDTRNGTIKLLGGMDGGTVQVGGTLDASAPNGGNGGFIETSAAHVKVADGAKITTASSMGLAGTWLIDPVDFTIAASGGDMTGAALTASLGSGNVSILSTSGTTGTTGDVNVNDMVTWSANRLTLNAQNNININATMNGSGSASLALQYGQGAVAAGNTSDTIVRAAVNLPAGPNFSTKLGSDGVVKNYTVITSLGEAGSRTGTDLQGMNGGLTGNYVLGSNIDATATSGWNSGFGFEPIGYVTGVDIYRNNIVNPATQFSGSFNGLGHTITGLTIYRFFSDYVGLFGITTSAASISNLGLVGGSVSGGGGVGALVGWSNGSVVSNSYATGAVHSNGDYFPHGGSSVGGLVGVNNGNISNSYATGNVNGIRFIGGLVGENHGTVSNSYATGDASGSYDTTGGLVGVNSGTVSNTYATGHVDGGVRGGIGGLVGWNRIGGTVGNSYATGDIFTDYGVAGGLVGTNEGAISNSYATGGVVGNTSIPGAASTQGGLVGFNIGTISNSYATGDVIGYFYLGGLVGDHQGGTISNSFATGNISITGSYAGGLVGRYSGGTVSNSYASGGVNGIGGGTLTDANGVATGQVLGYSSFANAGWSIADTGGSTAVWRIFEGSSVPQLRSFLTPVTLTPVYDGSAQTLTNISAYTANIASPITGNIINTAAGLTLSSTNTPGSQTAVLKGFTSTQQGYDISYASRTITGTGSAANDLTIANALTWSAGKLTLNAQNNININANLNASGSVSLALQYGQGAAAAGNTGNYALSNGAQVSLAAGPNFSTNLGSDGAVTSYTVITSLGAAADATTAPGTVTLQGMAATANLAGNYMLGGDIDATATSAWNAGAGFTPIGGTFTGTFDGLGHTVSNLTINRPAENFVGLFGYVVGSTIRNVELVGGSVIGRSRVGELVGHQVNGTISNSYAMGRVSGASYVGGLVGSNAYGTVSNSYATGRVSGTGNYVGGLMGANGGTVSNSYATGNVSASYSAGGLVGSNNGTISNSYATGSVSSTTPWSGGLVGINDGLVSNSFATGNVSGSYGVGGLVGFNDMYGGVVSNSYATGSVTGGDNVGGLVGYSLRSLVNNSYATGRVTGGANVGGLVGAFSGGTISNSYWDTTTSGQSTSAGGTGRTTAQMQQQSNFSSWDVANTWIGYDGHTNPLLRSFMTPLVVTANNATKTYDGLAYSGGNGVSYSSTPNANLLGTASYSGTSQIAKNAGSYTVAPGGLYSNQQGYIIGYANGALTVNPATLALSGTRVYDGSSVVAGSVLTATGVAGETFAVSGTGDTSNLASKNVQTASTLASLTGLALGTSGNGGLSTNYNALSAAGSSVSTTKAALALSAASDTKTYDATISSGGAVTVSGLKGGDTVTGATQAFDSKNAGARTLAVNGGYSVNDGNTGGNYDVTTSTAAGSITKAALALSAAADTRTYDATANSGGAVTAAGLKGDDKVTGATQAFDSRNAGARTLAVNGGYSVNDGNSGGNYDVTVNAAAGSIAKAALALSAAADTKTYDATTASSGAVTAAGLKGSDTVSGATQTFDSKNAGARTLAVNGGYSVNDGNGGGNYDVTTSTAAGTINKATLALNAASDTKTYDATTASSGAVTAAGLKGDDTVTGATQAFDSRNAGARTLAVNGGYSVNDGNSGGNYDVTVNTAAGTIAKAALALSAAGDTKTYDATISSGGVVAVSGLQGSDTVTGTTQAFDSRNAGARTLAVNGGYSVNDGNGGGNYDVTVNTAAGAINEAALTASISGTTTKVYDGTTAATIVNGNYSLSGFVAGESATVNQTAGTYNSKDVATATTVSVVLASSNFAGTGSTLLSNYLLPTTASGTGAISAATLTYAANLASMTQGSAVPSLSGSVTGFVVGETLASATTGIGTWLTPATSTSLAGTYAINGGGLTANFGNYKFIQAPGNATALTITTSTGVCGTGKQAKCHEEKELKDEKKSSLEFKDSRDDKKKPESADKRESENERKQTASVRK